MDIRPGAKLTLALIASLLEFDESTVLMANSLGAGLNCSILVIYPRKGYRTRISQFMAIISPSPVIRLVVLLPDGGWAASVEATLELVHCTGRLLFTSVLNLLDQCGQGFRFGLAIMRA
jgi:hypothetical protein